MFSPISIFTLYCLSSKHGSIASSTFGFRWSERSNNRSINCFLIKRISNFCVSSVTFKVGICIWPFIQTLNYAVIPERNRVPFVSLCSLAWTTFLAYMKQLEGSHFKQHQPMQMDHEKKQMWFYFNSYLLVILFIYSWMIAI